MENGPIFELSQGNIILDDKEDEEDFENMINDLQHHHNDDNNSNYVAYNYYGDAHSLGLWEVEYAAMDEEEGMIVTDDDIAEYEDISDHEYGSNENEEEK